MTIFQSSDEEIKNIHGDNLAIILPFFEEWAASGLLIDKPARILAETTNAVLYFIYFRNEIEGDDFSEIMDTFIDMLAEYIIKKDNA